MLRKISGKTLLWGSIAINVGFLSLFVVKKYFIKPDLSNINFANAWNMARQDVLSEIYIDTSSIVFIGNSLTEGFPLNEMYRDTCIKNLGISANWVQHVLGRLPAILKGKPKKVFVEVGTNDLQGSEDNFQENYTKLAQLIKSSGVTTYVQTLPPTCMDKIIFQPTVVKYNQFLRELCKKYGIPVIDIYPHFVKDGRLDTAYTFDGVHLNRNAYRMWKKVLDPYVL